jgi:uncharacterized protein (TIGR00369 family)
MTSIFEPKDSNYQAKVEKSFAEQAVMKTINASIASLEAGEIEIEFPYQAELTQQNGFIHAGIVSTVLDSACGYAAYSLMPEDASVLTVEFKVNLLSPAKGERFCGYGKVKKPGRSISVAEAELYAYSDQGKKLVATMVGTLMAIYPA